MIWGKKHDALTLARGRTVLDMFKEGEYSVDKWFAWHPVFLVDGRWVWLQTIERRYILYNYTCWRLYRVIPILCIDFDGVIHSYKSGWKGALNIPDPPVIGAIEWLRSLLGCPDNIGIKNFKVCIFSSRSRYLFGRLAMKRWLRKWGMTKYEIKLIHFPLLKPAAFLILDDRALTFTGIFPKEEELLNFQVWYKKRKKNL